MLEFLLPKGLLEAVPPSWYAVIRPGDLHVPLYRGEHHPALDDDEVRILVIEEGGAVDVFVAKYAASLGYAGDAWFQTRELAITDCEEQYGVAPSSWMPVPETENPPEQYVLTTVADQHGQ